MTTVERIDGASLLDHEIDELLLQARGIVLVRQILARTHELARVRRRLAEAIARG
jgi:hypothetical protein